MGAGAGARFVHGLTRRLTPLFQRTPCLEATFGDHFEHFIDSQVESGRFYRIRVDTIRIERILHGAQDVKAVFGGGRPG